jgi:hypothetical protein
MSLTAQRGQTVDYSDILRGSAALAGFTLADVGTPEFQLFRTFHDRRLQVAWEIHPWPDIYRIEQRSFRAKWDATGATVYAPGDEVLDPVTQTYFQCLQASPANALAVGGAGNPAVTGTYVYDGGTFRYVAANGYYIYFTSGMGGGHWVLFTNLGVGIYYQTDTYFMSQPAVTNPWVGTPQGAGTLPNPGVYPVQPPTFGGVENSAYWAQCRTSYTANPYDPAAIYNIGDQVQNLSDLNFYQRIVSTGAVDGGFNPAQWGLLKVFDRSIAYVQPGQTPIGEFLQAWDKNPYVTTKRVKLDFLLDNTGAHFVQLRNTFNYGWAPASTNFSYVWLQFRLPRPLLDGDAFDASLVYTAGRSVYYTSTATGKGNFYVAQVTTTAGDTPESAPAKWSLVAIPYVFRGYLIQAGYLDWLMNDGQNEKAAALEPSAEQLLELEADKLQRQSQQIQRFDWRS